MSRVSRDLPDNFLRKVNGSVKGDRYRFPQPGDTHGVEVVCAEQTVANSNHPARREATCRMGDCLDASRTRPHTTVGGPVGVQRPRGSG